MSKNFEKFNNGEGENEKEYTKEEVQEAIYNSFLDANMILFASLRDKDLPEEFMRVLEEDYNQFIQELIKYFNEKREIMTFFTYFKNRYPNNLWVSSIEEALGNELDSQNINLENIGDAVRKFISDKRKGTNIQ